MGFLFKRAAGEAVKIWFIASINKNSAGGVNRSINTLSEGVKRAGHKVKIIYAGSPREENYLFFALRTGLLFLLNFFDRPDRIIARSTDGVFCALISKLFKLKTKVVLYNHGWEEKVFQIERRLPLSAVTNRTTWKSRIIRFPLLRLSLSLCSSCICGTLEEARWISRKHPFARKKLRVVPNGINLPEAPFWASQEEIPPSFLIVGSFTWKKNIEYGIGLFEHILSYLPDARLFLVGTGSIPDSKQNLLSSLGDSLFIVEKESPDKISRWYETCPYLISTSRYEGGRSFAILEAQSYGLVVFATDIPSSRETISESHSGVLIGGVDLKQDAKKVFDLCNSPEEFKALSVRAFRNASRHKIDRQVNRLLRALVQYP